MDQTEMRKSEPRLFPFTDRLDTLLADASRASISNIEIAGKL
jgi:hypothetical protein